MSLDPQAKALLDMVYRVGAPRFHELDVHQARHSFEKLQFALRPEAPAVASVTDVPIPQPHVRDGVIMARLYRPIGAAPDALLPLVFYFHGGGWCIGNIPSYDVLCREVANLSGCAVLSVDYRLAPEHPFPAAVNDALRSVEWSLANGALLGIDPSRFALMGDSAGGNLSAVTALQLRNGGGPRAALQLLIYPSTDILSQRPSRRTYAQGYFLDTESLAWFFEKYLPDEQDWTDWRASPILAKRFDGLPPALIITAGCDPLSDDGRAYGECLREAGVEVEWVNYEGMVHGFVTLGKFFPQAGQAVERASIELRKRLVP
ncbi:alpha/beta hydrolase [Zoogloea sp.]|uniref:alpha/beta hydrolase n=1 Tax=Zoogloea sp. TaxID=49181 RepID=UPI0026136B15|nr:alpha/beta hydrolase [Zoogloea sp.]MDD3353612.1 alpha/beta hydrolase [Zoogloea sp.]